MATKFRTFPLMHQAAEHLVMGYLMRRNIMVYKAPENNAGYDLICIHPNPRRKSDVVRVQVKSRYQTDSDGAVVVRQSTFSAFDFLVIVFLNIGWYYDEERRPIEGREPATFITLPRRVAKRWWHATPSGMDRVHTAGRRLDKYTGDDGFELIADQLVVRYPRRS